MFAYREIAPSPELAPYVKCFWRLRTESAEPSVERILPDASFELIFQLGESFSTQPRAMLMGELRRPVIVQPPANADVFGVRFHPGGAAPFLGLPAEELRDILIPVRNVIDLEQRVLDARSTRDRVTVVESMLVRRFRSPRGEAVARFASQLIARRHGALPIRDVAGIAGTTERSLERAFAVNIGLSAKVFSRLMRFHSFLRGESDGYFDDSHRIRDCQDFAGTTPAALLRERNAMNAAFVGNGRAGIAPARSWPAVDDAVDIGPRTRRAMTPI